MMPCIRNGGGMFSTWFFIVGVEPILVDLGLFLLICHEFYSEALASAAVSVSS